MSTVLDQDQVFAIAQEVFTAMVDSEPGFLRTWDGPTPDLPDPLVAWVDVDGELSGRAGIRCEADTAHHLVRALLGMPAQEPVGPEDLVDAFGEVANVVGGNVKALLPSQGTLTLPRVAAALPDVPDGTIGYQLRLDWRGRFLDLLVWLFP